MNQADKEKFSPSSKSTEGFKSLSLLEKRIDIGLAEIVNINKEVLAIASTYGVDPYPPKPQNDDLESSEKVVGFSKPLSLLDNTEKRKANYAFFAGLILAVATCGLIYAVNVINDRNSTTTNIIAFVTGMFGFASVEQFRRASR
ncbi:hypothetical protein Pse7367_0368 [Thalassoporum mexicanum PCC 7367]|uniref:hypothetical protein n=1 Tax=Thalassoporum mexicanum TaxID=3457544 RepID=UPI00029F9377|nr:hypothetical protein [Pseudanabaena sp. PCC 7367]AFY68679.1 hypothetical protein Pse7367_0368 [Pseudanabaena sp. PCC 7367]